MNAMGKIIQRAKLTNSGDLEAVHAGFISADKIRQTEVDFLVDTGAAMICLPPDVIASLGLRRTHEREVMTANGKVKRGVYSPVRIEIRDRDADLNVMELLPGTPPLLGYLALEALDLYPNPQKQTLEGNPKYDGKMVVDCL
ncbi:MAG: retropepsin-like domain-containing protein [Verrucomicrobia bacterium]|nr:retropepsin-like domain-containing protein [Verrucomicrobiota bacterium]